MKIRDIITEAKMNPDIKQAMISKGYEYVGRGQDQDVFLAPDGTILKIFGTDYDASGLRFSEGQQSVIDFIKFCQSQPNNPFLPTFGGFERFEFDGDYYVQISCERLFDVNEGDTKDIANELEMLVSTTGQRGGNVQLGMDRLNRNTDPGADASPHYRKYMEKKADATAKLIMMLGGEGPTMQLLNTIKQLGVLARRKGYGYDLHSGNFMLGSDGHIVINDPFFTGTFR